MSILSMNMHRRTCRAVGCEKQNVDSVVLCVLRGIVTSRHRASKLSSNIILYYCYYLHTNYPLKGLIMALKNDQFKSVYMKGAILDLQEILSVKLLVLQRQSDGGVLGGKREEGMDLYTVHKTLQSPALLLGVFRKLVEEKIKYWTKLLNGYNSYSVFYRDVLALTDQLLRCQDAMDQRFSLKESKLRNAHTTDILTLKLLCIYYSAIYSNSLQSFAYDKEIQDNLRSEMYQQINGINNSKIHDSRVVVLQTSFVRKRGELINSSDKQVQKIFNKETKNQNVTLHINNLLPLYLRRIHDHLMDAFIDKGYSSMFVASNFTFYLNSQQFISPCSINLHNMLDVKNDYVLSLIMQIPTYQQEYVLFAPDGLIQGLTEKFFLYIQSLHDQKFGIQDINDNAYIQFYLPTI